MRERNGVRNEWSGVSEGRGEVAHGKELDMEEKKHLFTIDGVVLSGVILLCDKCVKLCGESMPHAYLYAGLTLAGTIALDMFYRETKEEKLFRNCGFENKDKQIPLIIKKQVTEK